MTRQRKGMGGWTAILGLALIAGIALVGTGTVDLSAIGGDGYGDDVNVDEWGVDAQVSFPTSPSSADVVLFNEQPENFGNYNEFSMSNAKDGLEVGIDYQEQTGVTSDTATFNNLESGTYYLVVEDSNYNTVFKQVEMPETVSQSFAENDKAVTLANSRDMTTMANYGTDNIVSYEGTEVLGTGSNLPAPSVQGEKTFTIERTISVDTGTSLLGTLSTTNFNMDDGIQDVEATVTADGSQVYSASLKEGSSGELSDSTSFEEMLRSDAETNPVRSNDEVTVSYEVTADVSNTGGDYLQDSGSTVTLSNNTYVRYENDVPESGVTLEVYSGTSGDNLIDSVTFNSDETEEVKFPEGHDGTAAEMVRVYGTDTSASVSFDTNYDGTFSSNQQFTSLSSQTGSSDGNDQLENGETIFTTDLLDVYDNQVKSARTITR